MTIAYTVAGGARYYARRDHGGRVAWDSDRAKAAEFESQEAAEAFLAAAAGVSFFVVFFEE